MVVHVGTLSKIFSPDLRLGFVVGPGPLISRTNALRAAFDRHGDVVLERAMAELMEDGELQRHLNRMDKVYRSRRDALCAGLAEAFPGSSGSFRRRAGSPSGPEVESGNRRRCLGGARARAWRVLPSRAGASPSTAARSRVFASGSPTIREPELREVARRMRSALEDLG